MTYTCKGVYTQEELLKVLPDHLLDQYNITEDSARLAKEYETLCKNSGGFRQAKRTLTQFKEIYPDLYSFIFKQKSYDVKGPHYNKYLFVSKYSAKEKRDYIMNVDSNCMQGVGTPCTRGRIFRLQQALFVITDEGNLEHASLAESLLVYPRCTGKSSITLLLPSRSSETIPILAE